MLSGVQPKFGAIKLHDAGMNRASFTVTLTDEDLSLKPKQLESITGKPLDVELPDTFRVTLGNNPDKAQINYWSADRMGHEAYTSKKSNRLQPLIETMTERGAVDEALAKKLTEHHGLSSEDLLNRLHYGPKEHAEKLEKSNAAHWNSAARVAREIARYPRLTIPEGQGDAKDFYPQDYRDITAAFNAFREFVGLKPHPEEPIACSAVTAPIGSKGSRFKLLG